MTAAVGTLKACVAFPYFAARIGGNANGFCLSQKTNPFFGTLQRVPKNVSSRFLKLARPFAKSVLRSIDAWARTGKPYVFRYSVPRTGIPSVLAESESEAELRERVKWLPTRRGIRTLCERAPQPGRSPTSIRGRSAPPAVRCLRCFNCYPAGVPHYVAWQSGRTAGRRFRSAVPSDF